MSVNNFSRFVGLMALDYTRLPNYMDEATRPDEVAGHWGELDDNETALLLAGDFNGMFSYIAESTDGRGGPGAHEQEQCSPLSS